MGDIIGGNIQVNGQSYAGRNVTVRGNRITVDGKDVTPDAKEINITVACDLDTLSVDYANQFAMTGNAGVVFVGSGDLTLAGNVGADVRSGSGDIEIRGIVSGSVTTGSGDVECGVVHGSVKSGSGDIKYRRA